MLNFLNLQPEIFGVDINDLSLRIIKLKKKRKGFDLISFNEVKIKPGIIMEGTIQDKNALAEIIKMACKTVRGKKLNTKYVAVSLPEEKSFSQVIQMPKMTDEELKYAVPFEAESYIPLAIDKVYWDFEVINRHEGAVDLNHVDLIINVMPKPIVDSYAECFKKAGLVPCILEVESQAIVRALVKPQEDLLPSIFIDFGQTKSSFVIFSGRSIRFTSSIPISSKQLTEAIAKGLSISFEDAEQLKIKQGLVTKRGDKYNIANYMDPILSDLVNHIKKYINFYRGHVTNEGLPNDGRIEKIILCGGGSNLKKLPDFLFKKLKIHVELCEPFLNILNQKKNLIAREKKLSFTTALGLAQRGASITDLGSGIFKK